MEIAYTKNNTKLKTQSEVTAINRGNPQESVLGPVLFLLPDRLEDAVIYADDTILNFAD